MADITKKHNTEIYKDEEHGPEIYKDEHQQI